MVATCKQADPLGWLSVGKTYYIHKRGKTYSIDGLAMGLSERMFNVHFDIVEP